MVRNYLRSGNKTSAGQKSDGLIAVCGLSLLDPEITTKALLGKWLIYNLELGETRLKVLF